jgi:hypothetical protein
MKSGDALAFFDAAYLAHTLCQIAEVDDAREMHALTVNVRGIARDVDAYALMTKSLALRQDDPELHFAAALVASLRPEHRAFCELMRTRRGPGPAPRDTGC